MKNKIIFTVLMVLLTGILIFVFLPKGQNSTGPRENKTARDAKQIIKQADISQSKKIATEDNAAEGLSKEPVSGAQKTVPDSRDAVRTRSNARLEIIPERLIFEVEEGQRAKSSFQIMNNGKDPIYANIYKASLEAEDGMEGQLEKFISLKQEKCPGGCKKDELAKANFFSGTAWISPFPYYAVLEPVKPISIEVTIEARDLKEGQYDTYLFAVGKDRKESLIIPIIVNVKAAPKIEMTKIRIDDGFSKGTRGNTNRAANPGERVGLEVTLKNNGFAPAEDLQLRVSSPDPAVSLASANNVKVMYIRPQEEFQVRFLFNISLKAHPSIPPSVVLTIIDGSGKRWVENFYLGEKGTFAYPTGLIIEKVPKTQN